MVSTTCSPGRTPSNQPSAATHAYGGVPESPRPRQEQVTEIGLPHGSRAVREDPQEVMSRGTTRAHRVPRVSAAQQLIRAVDASDLDGVQKALLAGADPNTRSEEYVKTPVLTAAARLGAAEIVQALLAAGAAPDPDSGYEWTPLRAAATYGRAQVVRLLLAAGVGLNPSSRRGAIIMDAVASTRHWPKPESLKTVRLLLDAGATVRPEDDPAVVLAVASGSPSSVVRLLLQRGADPSATRSDGTPAIVIAAMRRDARLVDELLAGGAEVDAPDANGRTALMHAVERGSNGIVASLLCAGADKDRKPSTDRLPMPSHSHGVVRTAGS